MNIKQIEHRATIIKQRSDHLIDLFHATKSPIKKQIANRLIKRIDKELCYLEEIYRKEKFRLHKERQLWQELSQTPSYQLN